MKRRPALSLRARRWYVAWAFFFLPLVVGCQGCRDGSADADPTDRDDQVQEDFTSSPPVTFPADSTTSISLLKPGHWTTAAQTIRSNNADARGDLESRIRVTPPLGPPGLDNAGRVEVLHPGVGNRRPLVLPKGQKRRFEFRLLPPIPAGGEYGRVLLESRLDARGRAVPYTAPSGAVRFLQPSEYLLVVLTTRPQRFTALQSADWTGPFRDVREFTQVTDNYRIVIPPTDQGVLPLGETMLDWTATAALYWDDVSPDTMTPAQIDALEDWVHFGGRLIVGGPDASLAIKDSVLADLLPLRPTGNIELDTDAATDLLEKWSIEGDPTTDRRIEDLTSVISRVAVDGRPAADAVAVDDTAGLMLRRMAGRGMVTQSRFDLSAPWVTRWESYDSFFNAICLGRPHREYVGSFRRRDDTVKIRFVDSFDDSVINSGVRIAARDLVRVVDDPTVNPAESDEPLERFDESDIDRSRGTVDSNNPVRGVAAWSDVGDWPQATMTALRSASGIEIPPRSLVVRSLGAYLLILVPLNWLVFWLWGRLEWAWLMIPFIAVGGAIWVARAARLDIGFARSQSEITVLEVPAGHDRGHVTRMVSIYNSLASRYDIDFDDVNAAAAPLWASGRGERGNDAELLFETSYAAGPRLSGLTVASNQVRMVRAEQIVDLGGEISFNFETGELINASEQTLTDVLITRAFADRRQLARIDLLPPGSRRTVSLGTSDRAIDPAGLKWRLAELGFGNTAVLVARIEDRLPGMTVTPTATQLSHETFVLVHLESPTPLTPRKDLNLAPIPPEDLEP